MNKESVLLPYAPFTGNSPVRAKVFRLAASSQECYVRLHIDYLDNDLLITLGPLTEDAARRMHQTLIGTSCHLYEIWDAPFEGDIERGPDPSVEPEEA